ncbi:hypothetical protein P3T86_09680 [Staphylococcus nepalensis]|uniref:hypothetical protein n=1 Tax=Staphylococcus nepalensis TaxID=214473 RepID=UPI002B2575F6|nr:hypothetical protein [Staphylococcus nepalensis]WQL19458.1 hypothetical protein P3T86_09680 [Staphylococcus nepalensis]
MKIKINNNVIEGNKEDIIEIISSILVENNTSTPYASISKESFLSNGDGTRVTPYKYKEG